MSGSHCLHLRVLITPLLFSAIWRHQSNMCYHVMRVHFCSASPVQRSWIWSLHEESSTDWREKEATCLLNDMDSLGWSWAPKWATVRKLGEAGWCRRRQKPYNQCFVWGFFPIRLWLDLSERLNNINQADFLERTDKGVQLFLAED